MENDHKEQPWADIILRPLIHMSDLELASNFIPGHIHKLYTMYGKPVPEYSKAYEKLTENRVVNNPDWVYKKKQEDQQKVQTEARAAGAKPVTPSSSEEEWEAKLDHNQKKELITMRARKLDFELLNMMRNISKL